MDYVNTSLFIAVLALIYTGATLVSYVPKLIQSYKRSMELEFPAQVWLAYTGVILVLIVLNVWSLYWVGQMWWFDLQDIVTEKMG